MGAGSAHLHGGQFYGQVAQQRRIGDLLLSEVVHVAPREFPRHAHEHTYVNLLLSGTYAEQIGRRPVEHGRLSMTVRPAGIEHRDRVGDHGGRFFMVEMGRGWLDGLQVPAKYVQAPVALAAPDSVLMGLRLYGEFRRWDHCSPQVAEGLSAALLTCARHDQRGRHAPPWLARVSDMVHDSFRGPVSLCGLAREAGVNPAYLSRTFRLHFGRTPGELARELRVLAVCNGMRDPRRTLADLAYANGFADQAHMTRIVTRHLGTTPRRLRALLDGAPAVRS